MTSVTYPNSSKSTTFSKSRLLRFLTTLSLDLDIGGNELSDAATTISLELPATINVNNLLELAAESLAQKIVMNPDYSLLAGRVYVFAIKRQIPCKFAANFEKMNKNKHPKTGEQYPLVSDDITKFVTKHQDFLDNLIVASRDNDLSYFGMKTLAKSYLLKANDVIMETPQFMFLRVAIGIHVPASRGDESSILAQIARTYDLMSQKYFLHASPTLFNASTPSNYLSLCFLMSIEDDSIDGIYKTLHKTALISKASGGIGLHVNNIRSRGSLIKSSNGSSNGLVPMLRVFNSTARYVDQGGNKRPGAIAIYIEPWHGDIEEILDLRKNHGNEEMRARDLFYALWVPDLFMKRVKDNDDWSLFSPSDAPGLADVYGPEFEELFTKYEKQGLATTTIKARKLWIKILEAQTETGMPFMLYKDACNEKLNQKNLGTIKSSNLCCEVVQYSSDVETAVCNLALVALPSFVIRTEDFCSFDFSKLHEVVKQVTRNLDQVIDSTLYPTDSTKSSNMRHRPIAIGVQGLADVFMQLRLPFDSKKAKTLNVQIFETIYHAAIESSMEMSVEFGPYETFQGSPASKGILQFDMWNHKPTFYSDWDELKSKVKTLGLRNSLLVAPMPTASTSQILGFNECFEPFTSNIYLRRVLSGEFQVINKYLVKDLKDLGLWSSAMKDQIIIDDGLIQNIDAIPDEIKSLYKTVWELSQKVIVNMAVDRGRFVDQLQSLNIHLKVPTFKSLTSCHFYGWENGLKTGMYYLRTKAASRAIQFSVDPLHTKVEISKMKRANIGHLKRPTYLEAKAFKRSIREPHQRVTRLKTFNKGDITAKNPQAEPETPISDFPDSFSIEPNSDDFELINTATPPEAYDIYDTTPLSCNLIDFEGCESCSA